MVGMSRGRITQIVNNANFCEINNLLIQGHDMEYIAGHCHMDLAQARPPRLSGNQVQKMQDKRILGTVGRTLLVAKRL